MRIPYHTRYGGTSSSTVVYYETVRSLGLALHRQFNVRKPELRGYCARLFRQQRINLPRWREVFKNYKHALAVWFVDYRGSLEEEVLRYAEAHPKRRARILAHFESIRTGSRVLGPRLVWGRVLAKFKVELAKAGKVPRIIVDLGVMASLVGAWFAKTLKEAMACEPLEYGDFLAWFCPSASYTNLKKAFDRLWEPTHRYTLIVFSDDAALAIRQADGTVVWFDIDISSCDKSHGAELFDLLRAVCPSPWTHELEWLLDQLRAPLLIRSPNRDVRESFRARPKCETLYSGSVLTTLVNNVAVMAIGLQIAASQAATVAGIVHAASEVGYIVTCKVSTRFEDVQFLKHSPARDIAGVWQPLCNLGVFVRSAGFVWGELPVFGQSGLSLMDRARLQHGAHLRCTWPNTHFPMLDRAREAYPTTSTAVAHFRAIQARENAHRELDGWPELWFTDASVLNRYDLREQSVPALDSVLGGPLGYCYTGSDVDTILYKDYELRNAQSATPRQPADEIPVYG